MNQASNPYFLSTAIPYVNAEPHLGHAFELLLADALARSQRQRGRQVHITGGTDDHSLKNARAASAHGVSTSAWVKAHAERFAQLPVTLGVTLDDYLHTSSDPRHRPAVLALWQRCLAAGDLYQRTYEGRYCVGCEAFLDERELVDGLCPTHRRAPEIVRERNWFFRLSRYQAQLANALTSGELRITPIERQNEVESLVRGGLVDFSVSRSRERARGWGIPVPGDDEQVIYVWFDALASYLSALGFPAPGGDWQRYWCSDGAREHLLGKDILRFHAVYWPAILRSAGLPLPSRLLAHGFVTLEGNKIAKSAGNAIDPFELVERFGRSAVRFYCLRHLHSTRDSDFRVERLREAHDSELAGKLGNLLQRVCSVVLRHPSLAVCRGRAAESDADQTLRAASDRAVREVNTAVDAFALHEALASIIRLAAAANQYADAEEPWTLSRRAKTAATRQATSDLLAQLAHVSWHLLEALRVIAVLLAPFLPDAARAIIERLGVDAAQLDDAQHARFGWRGVFRPSAGPPLFPRLGAPSKRVESLGPTPAKAR